MIISLRGTNGAGKSTIVRSVMKHFNDVAPIMVPGRRNPIGYKMAHLFIPGHYEIANGGIDTIDKIELAYELIKFYDSQGFDVLYEGKNMSDGVTNITKLPESKVRIIVVDHPIDQCVESVRSRGHGIKEETIRRLEKKVSKEAAIFQERGYPVFRLSRGEAYSKCLDLLRIGC